MFAIFAAKAANGRQLLRTRTETQFLHGFRAGAKEADREYDKVQDRTLRVKIGTSKGEARSVPKHDAEATDIIYSLNNFPLKRPLFLGDINFRSIVHQSGGIMKTSLLKASTSEKFERNLKKDRDHLLGPSCFWKNIAHPLGLL